MENFEHNQDVNPDWKPKVAYRVYACCECGTETQVHTNHTGKIYNTECRKCRDIVNPHTARERVFPGLRSFNYVRDV